MAAPEIRESLSWVPLKITPTFCGEELSKATGFFYRHSERSFLITNYHVVSGINPITGKILESNGRVPDTLILGVPSSETQGPGPKKIQWKWRQLPLYTESDNP